MVKIATWNINSVRKRISQLITLLDTFDIILLQETKCINEDFPKIEGIECAVFGQKSYNGVAILSRYPIIHTEFDPHQEARYIECTINCHDKDIKIASIYVPNGKTVSSEHFTYKMRFFDFLHQHAQKLMHSNEIIILGGDYNVAPFDIDVYAPRTLDGKIGFHQDERAKFRKLTNTGLIDAFRIMHPDSSMFSWWDYRSNGFKYNRGMRLDHLLLSPEAADLLVKCSIVTEMRGLESASDHAPVVCEIKTRLNLKGNKTQPFCYQPYQS